MTASRQGEDMARAILSAVEFHKKSASDADQLWDDGLHLLLNGFDALNGHKDIEPQQRSRLARLWGAFRCRCCGRRPLRGTFRQSTACGTWSRRPRSSSADAPGTTLHTA